jgi:hypothetical protein
MRERIALSGYKRNFILKDGILIAAILIYGLWKQPKAAIFICGI